MAVAQRPDVQPLSWTPLRRSLAELLIGAREQTLAQLGNGTGFSCQQLYGALKGAAPHITRCYSHHGHFLAQRRKVAKETQRS